MQKGGCCFNVRKRPWKGVESESSSLFLGKCEQKSWYDNSNQASSIMLAVNDFKISSHAGTKIARFLNLFKGNKTKIP